MMSFLQTYIFFLLVSCIAARYGALPVPDSLSPRYALGVLPQLEDRQNGCALNSHSCMDINSDACCLNTQYCYIDPSDSVKCCAIGSPCDNECSLPSQYRCGEVTAVVSELVTTTASCCERTCTSLGAFLCGSNCCDSGASCSEGQCKTTSSSTVVVQMSSTTANTAAQRTGSQATDGSTAVATDSGLSPGAKAGIGVGISIVFLLMGAAIVWFCVVHRRMVLQSEGSSAEPAMSEANINHSSPTHPGSNNYFGTDTTSGAYANDDFQVTSATSTNYDRGVPLNPQSPGDITSPVELDSEVMPYLKGNPKSQKIVVQCTELS
ncbi:hypothetical protein PVAG01_06696 [Phlyctema vagabunda]|uniref:Uncharacterized protein n=1 Tax=Phlyctema vagabunda TaxID=108571 RepID=A0ABR4PGX9_9HELO